MNQSEKALMGLAQFKSECSLICEDEDLFYYASQHYGCSENAFEKWLNKERIFIKRYAIKAYVDLYTIRLTEDTWRFYTERYERESKTQHLVAQYPEGYFEAVGKDGIVACFLPDTYGEKPYRLAFYRDVGPTYHETYRSREEALDHLAKRGFVAQAGALERLSTQNSDKWNQGLWITKWISEHLTPYQGLQRDSHIPEVQQLFATALTQLN